MIHVLTVSDANIQAVLDALSDKSTVTSIIEDVMDGARAFWIQQAGQKLTTSRRDYIQGIQKVQIKGETASIALVGTLPNLVENGMSAYDMHDTLLGPNVPVVEFGAGKGKHARKDGGFWRVIPFRHQAPGTIGQGGGVPMGNPYEGKVDNAAQLGKSIYKAAKKLAPSTGMPGGKTQWGERLPEGMAPKLKPQHATDIYAGMTRMEKTYEKATQSSYMTFRVISDGVPDKWHHPGLPGVFLAKEVQKFVDKQAQAAFAALIGGGTP